MLVVVLGLVLTTVLVVKLARRPGLRAADDAGSMSHQWVAVYRAAERASSL
jgi:hypothetical protein